MAAKTEGHINFPVGLAWLNFGRPKVPVDSVEIPIYVLSLGTRHIYRRLVRLVNWRSQRDESLPPFLRPMSVSGRVGAWGWIRCGGSGCPQADP